jgi:hypothetical protein
MNIYLCISRSTNIVCCHNVPEILFTTQMLKVLWLWAPLHKVQTIRCARRKYLNIGISTLTSNQPLSNFLIESKPTDLMLIYPHCSWTLWQLWFPFLPFHWQCYHTATANIFCRPTKRVSSCQTSHQPQNTLQCIRQSWPEMESYKTLQMLWRLISLSAPKHLGATTTYLANHINNSLTKLTFRWGSGTQSDSSDSDFKDADCWRFFDGLMEEQFNRQENDASRFPGTEDPPFLSSLPIGHHGII